MQERQIEAFLSTSPRPASRLGQESLRNCFLELSRQSSDIPLSSKPAGDVIFDYPAYVGVPRAENGNSSGSSLEEDDWRSSFRISISCCLARLDEKVSRSKHFAEFGERSVAEPNDIPVDT